MEWNAGGYAIVVVVVQRIADKHAGCIWLNKHRRNPVADSPVVPSRREVQNIRPHICNVHKFDFERQGVCGRHDFQSVVEMVSPDGVT